MKLIVISHPLYFAGEAKLINQLFEAGTQVLHLRKEIEDRERYRNLIEEIDRAFYARLALNNFHELAGEFGIRRLHFSEKKRLAGMGETVKCNQILSTSIHDLKNLEEVKRFNYVFYGPVFNSISKPGYKSLCEADFKLQAGWKKLIPEVNEDELAMVQASEAKAPDIIALGGIDANRVEQINEMNFDGLAVLGAIWNKPLNAIANFKILQEKCGEKI